VELQKLREEEASAHLRRERKGVDALVLAKAAQEHSSVTRKNRKELQEIRNRLVALQQGGGGDGEVVAVAAAEEEEEEEEYDEVVSEDGSDSGVHRATAKKGNKGGAVKVTAQPAGGKVAESTKDARGSRQLEQVGALLRRKAELLETGLYSADDPLIVELDRGILAPF